MTGQGDVIALWRSFEGGPYRIYGSVRPAGGSFSPATSLSPVESVVESIDVVADSTGNTVATWRQGLGGEKVVLFSSFRPAGGELQPAAQVLGAGEHVFQPDTDMNPSGDAITVYRRAPGSDDHIAYVLRPAGGDFGAQQEITTYKAEYPTVGLADDGTAIAAWRTTGTKIEAARRPPGGSFGAIQPVSESGSSVSQVSVAPGGRALLAWRRVVSGHEIVEAALAEPGGEFGAPVPLSSPGVDSVRVESAIGPDGLALVSWRDGGDGQLHVAVAPPGAGFESAPAPPTDMSPTDVKFGDNGSLALVLGTNSSPFSIAAAIRDPAGQFGPITPLSSPGENAFSRSLSGDGAGNFVELFSIDDGGSSTLKVAGYDGVAPRFDSLAVPSRTRTGVKTAFSAGTFDVWGPVTTAWAFGDGGLAVGDSVTHTYGRTGGKRSVTATATDAAGNSTTDARAIQVKDVTRVVIWGARFRPRRFAVGRRSTALSAKLRHGSTLRFKLSERARVTVSFQRGVRGRRKGRRCVAPRAAPGGRRCTRFVRARRARSLRRKGRAGANKVRFSGRLRGRRLRPGLYRAVLRATDTGGLKAKPRRAPFRIVAR